MRQPPFCGEGGETPFADRNGSPNRGAVSEAD